MLLPPNATKQEKALVDAVDYKVDPSYVKGFKFSLGSVDKKYEKREKDGSLA